MDNRLKLYFSAVGWFILSLLSSSANDIIAKYSGHRLHSYEITFLRFFFGTFTLIPFILYYGFSTLKTSRPFIHFIRGFLLFLGMTGWTYGLQFAPVTTATIVSFMIPIFVLILGIFFLQEKIIWQRWVVTLVAFAGLACTLNPTASDFKPEVLVFVFSAIAFAILDITNKKFVIQETMISMLFYSAIITTIFAYPFANKVWIEPNFEEYILTFALGASANLILFFLLKAFALADATALAPYRYIELIVSAIVAYMVFGEIPTENTIFGSLIIIPSTLFIIYSENKEFKKKKDIN